VAVSERDNVALGKGRQRTLDDAVGARADLVRGLAPRVAVAPEVPAGPLLADLRRGESFVLAVVELPEVFVASWAVSRARRMGLVSTSANSRPARRSPSARAARSPSGVSSTSVRLVCLPLALHSVSPWRTRKTL
jgi:hypothetical protein